MNEDNSNHNVENLNERIKRMEAEIESLKGRLNKVEKTSALQVDAQAVSTQESSTAKSTAKGMPSLEDALQKQKLQAAKQFGAEDKIKEMHRPQPEKHLTNSGAFKLKRDLPETEAKQPTSSRPAWLDAKPIAKPAWDIKDVLRKLNLLPPTAGGNMEAQIGQWWISRIGAFLFVIGAVLGVAYLTRGVSPAVRFGELLTGSVAITALGWRLERRVSRFGTIVFGMGLALVFFTMFAGHVFEAVQVFERPLSGGLAQFLVVAAIVGIAIRRDSRVLGSMAVFLGYVAAFFSMAGDLDNYALVASVMLSVAAGCLYVWRAWAWPFFCGIIGSYLLLMAMTLKWALGADMPEHFWWACAWPLGQMILFGVCDAGAKWRENLMHRWARRAAQVLNTSGALLVGFILMTVYSRSVNDISSFYFVFGGVLVAGAVAYWSIWKSDVLMHVYFVKGSALVTLGLMTEFDSRTRWAALAVESIVLLFSAKRSRLKIVEGAMGLVWLASFVFFARDIIEPGYLFSRPANAWQFAWSGGLYVLISAFFLSLQAQWLGKDRKFLPSREIILSPRGLLNGVYAMVLGTAGILLARVSVGDAWLPLMALGVVAGLVLVAFASRHWLAWTAGLLPFVLAHGALWTMEVSETLNSGMIWLNGLVLAAVTLGLGVWLTQIGSDQAKRVLHYLATGFYIFGTLALQMVFFKTLSLEAQLLGGVAVGLAMLGASLAHKMDRLTMHASIPVIWGLLFVFNCAVSNEAPQWGESEHAMLVWLAMGTAVIWACLAGTWDRVRDNLRPENVRWQWDWWHTGLMSAVGFAGLCLLFQGPALMVAFGAGMVLLCILSLWPRLKPALPMALAFLAAAFIQFGQLSQDVAFKTTNGFMFVTIGVSLLAIAYAVACEHLRLNTGRKTREGLEWSSGLMALIMLFGIFYLRRDSLESYVTVLWGLSAFTVLAAGFAGRVRGLRFLALGAFAACIGRAFMVDILETVARIWAFLALGVSLLVVGYLYTQFKDKLTPPVSSNECGMENVKDVK